MTFWLDAHLDPELGPWMGVRFGIASKPLRDLGLRDADDVVLCEAAGRFGGDIVIVTKDFDFVTLVRRRGAPPKVLWLTCGNLSTHELQLLLVQRLPAAIAALESGQVVVEISGN